MGSRRLNFESLARAFDLVTRTHLATIGAILSAAVCVVAIFTLKSYYLFVTFFALFVACVLYLALRTKLASAAVKSLARLGAQAESRAHKAVSIVFISLMGASVVVLSSAVYFRPVLFLVLTSVLAALIAIEIAITADSRHVPSVLFKVIILGILIRVSAYFEFPSTISVDPYYHTGFIQYVLDHGYIPASAAPYAGLEYPSMPLMHMLVSALSLTTGFNVHYSYFFVGVVECVGVIFIFLIGRAALNERSGMLAALLLVVANQFLLWGIHITPLTIGIVLTLVVVAALFLVPRSDMASLTALLLLLFAGILLTHEGTAAYTAIVLVVVLTSFWVVSKLPSGATVQGELQDVTTPPLHLRSLALLVALFVGALIGYWTFIGGSALSRAVAILRGGVTPTSALTPPPGALAGALTRLPELPPSSLPVWTDLPVLILIFFATFGFLRIMGNQRKKALTAAWLGGTALMLVITAGTYFLGSAVSQPERWIVYLQVFMVTPAAAGILALGSLSNLRKGLVVIFSAVLVLGFVGVTHTNAKVASEMPWDQRPRIALVQSEVIAAKTIANITNMKPIQTDLAYAPIFKFQYNLSNVYVFSPLSDTNAFSNKNSSWVLRLEIADNPYSTSTGTVRTLGADRYESIEATQNVVYNAGNVQVVTAKS